MANFHTSLTFFAEVLAIALGYRLLAPMLGSATRHAVLAAISLAFLAQLDAHPAFLAATGLYAVVVAALALALGRVRWLNRSAGVGVGVVVAATIVLVAFKYRYYAHLLSGGLAELPGLSGFEWLGLSYMTFRTIDLVVQVRRRPELMPNPLAALSFLLFFPAYLSGPINRFPAFVTDVAAPLPVLSAVDLQSLASRMALGVIKVLLLAEIFRANSPIGLGAPEGIGAAMLMVGLFAQLAYIYCDFSGYSDVAITVARLFGIRLPENFNRPFLARNLQDFWNRWHISFVHWCRDYIYFILLRWLRLRVRWLSDLAANLTAIFVTFFFMGAWHGDGLNWLLYGLYHGTGMAVLVTARRLLPSETAAALSESRVFAVASMAFTLTFVALGLLLTHPLPFAAAGARILLTPTNLISDPLPL